MIRKVCPSLRSSFPFHLFLFALMACAPAGKPRLIIHPLNKLLIDRQAPQEMKAPTQISAQLLLKPGLPASCKADRTTDGLCFQCGSDPWLVMRCYDAEGGIDPKADCKYTPEAIKCLGRSQPFAIMLAYRSSQEKILRANFLQWRDAVQQIWDDKRLAADKSESDHIMQSLDWLTLRLSTQGALAKNEGEIWVERLGIESGASKIGQDFVETLQDARLDGTLNLKLVLEEFEGFYLRTHGSSNLWDELRTMSLEGMEE